MSKIACYYGFKSPLSKVIGLHPKHLATSLLLRATRDLIPGSTGSSRESWFDSNPAAPVAGFDLSTLKHHTAWCGSPVSPNAPAIPFYLNMGYGICWGMQQSQAEFISFSTRKAGMPDPVMGKGMGSPISDTVHAPCACV